MKHAPLPPHSTQAPAPPRRAAALGILALSITLGLLGCDGSSSAPTPDQADATATLEAMTPDQIRQATDDTELLQKKFSAVIKNNRSIRPLAPEVEALARRYPGFPDAHLLLAQVRLRMRRLDPALAELDRALALDPDQPEAARLAGSVLMMQDKYDDAAERYAKAVAAAPQRADLRVFRANALFKAGRLDAAEQALNTALRLDSRSDQAHALLSDVYAQQGQLAAAQQEIRAAIDALPEGARSRGTRLSYIRKRVNLLEQSGQPDAALAVLRGLPPEDQIRPAIADTIAGLWDELGQPERAAQHYEQILLIRPTNAHAAAEAARWRIKLGDLDRARDHLKTLRRINPRSPELENLTAKLADAGA